MDSIYEKLNNLVLDNEKLIHYILQHDMHIYGSNPNYEDLVSIGRIGLIKASKNFDETRNIKFVTYASRLITNEILMSFRKSKKYANDDYLSRILYEDNNGNFITVVDLIPDKSILDFEQGIIIKENLKKCFEIIFNCLNIKQKISFLYYLSGMTQRDISKNLNISQSYVSRIMKISFSKISRFFHLENSISTTFSIIISDEFYEIYFNPNFVYNYEKALNHLRNSNISEFLIIEEKDKISIRILAVQENLFIFAEFFKALYY